MILGTEKELRGKSFTIGGACMHSMLQWKPKKRWNEIDIRKRDGLFGRKIVPELHDYDLWRNKGWSERAELRKYNENA